MKLLSKSVVASEVASQKKMQIDEGILIAKKVDILREKLINLQTQEDEYIRGMQLRYKNNLSGLESQILDKEREIEILESKRIKLLEPLDEEWKKVRKESNNNESIKINLLNEYENVKKKELNIAELEKVTKQKLSNIKVRERELERSLSKSLENENKTENILSSIQDKEEQHKEYFLSKNQELLEREALVAVKERENDIARQRIEHENLEIIKTKTQLEDQRGVLERATKRIQNG